MIIFFGIINLLDFQKKRDWQKLNKTATWILSTENFLQEIQPVVSGKNVFEN